MIFIDKFLSKYILSVFIIVSFFSSNSFSQNNKIKADSAKTVKDSVFSKDNKKNSQQIKFDTIQKKHSPTKAWIMSAILPGLGQAYNKKYWKIPIIYGGLIALYYVSDYNNTRYKRYFNDYVLLSDTSVTVQKQSQYFGYYQASELKRVSDAYRRDRDFTYIVMGLIYILNIIDASVDAHLLDYNIDENISFHISPTILPTQHSNVYGFRIGIRF